MIQDIVAFLLKFVKPGYYKQSLFEQMCRLNTLLSIEIVCSTDKKILLKERDDKFFGKVWHIPGTMVRGNENLEVALERLLEEEIPSGKYEFKMSIDHVYFQKTPRGNIFHLVFRMKPISKKLMKKMKDKDNLPENTLEYHRDLIKENYS
jgi:ADP-ribose pyrophosphatase YjhB (NUDIX family)